MLELQRYADENVILPEDVSGKSLRTLTWGDHIQDFSKLLHVC